MSCPLCRGPSRPKVAPWTFHCGACDHWFCNSEAELGFEDERFFATCGDYDDPLGHLEIVRRRNFATLLNVLGVLGIKNGRILDVGCGSGLFLHMAAGRGFTPLGVEPKERMVKAARNRGVDVRIGLFPAVLKPNERFHAIFFNDVLEHIGPAAETLAACKQYLEPGGLVVVNVPDSHGLFFRVASLAYRLGVTGPYERLWQRMFYTPHLHYFSRGSLTLLAKNEGFRIVRPLIALPTLTVRGLWRRVAVIHERTLGNHLVQFAGALILAPFSFIAPDTQVAFLRSTTG